MGAARPSGRSSECRYDRLNWEVVPDVLPHEQVHVRDSLARYVDDVGGLEPDVLAEVLALERLAEVEGVALPLPALATDEDDVAPSCDVVHAAGRGDRLERGESVAVGDGRGPRHAVAGDVHRPPEATHDDG